MQKRESKAFFGKLDFDHDPRFVEVGDYLDIRNFRGSGSDQGADGTLENVKSLNPVTSLVDNTRANVTLPDGINKCIGSYTSESTSRSFIFLWNSEGDHTIWEYNFKRDELILLITDRDWSSSLWLTTVGYSVGDVVNIGGSQNYVCLIDHTSTTSNAPNTFRYFWKPINEYLNFGEFNLIYDIIEFTRDGDTILYFTDGENEVKSVNVDRLKRTSGDTYPTPYEEEYFDLIPTTPQLSIPIYYGIDSSATLRSSGSTTEPNSLTGKYYQFRYQWEYMDGQRSPLSPASKVAVTIPSIRMRRGIADYFQLKIPVRDSYTNSYCKKVYVYVREVNSNNTGDWYICKEIDATNTTQTEDSRVSARQKYSEFALGSTAGADQYMDWYNFDFYGDEPKLAADQTEINQLFSWLPKKVRTMCLVGDNRIFAANTLEGNDLDAEGLIEGSTISLTPTFAPTILSLDIPPRRTYKRGANHKFGIIYSDAKGRVSSVVPLPNEVSVPWYDAATMGSAKNGAYVQMQTEFDLTPPSWAEFYQIVYSKNRSYDVSGDSNEKFLQLQINNPALVGIDPVTSQVVSRGTLRYIDDFNILYQNNNSAVVYDFVKGDSIRLIYDQSAPDYFGNTTDILEGTLQSIDTATGEITWTADITNVKLLSSGDWVELYSPSKAQLSDEDLIWYEIGETYTIGVDSVGNKIHQGLSDRNLSGTNVDQDIDLGVDLKLYVSGGDCWVYTRSNARIVTPSNVSTLTDFISVDEGHGFYTGQPLQITDTSDPTTLITNPVWTNPVYAIVPTTGNNIEQVFQIENTLGGGALDITGASPTVTDYSFIGYENFTVESPYIEDFVESKSTDIGRPNIVTEEGLKEIKREATGRIGQAYVPNTDINKIGLFFDIDFTEYNKNYGSIQKVYTDSHKATIFQETKFGTIPISRSLIEDLEGQGLMGITSELLGKIQYSEEDYGIGLNGESHVSYGRYQWWADLNRNAICQLMPDGFVVVSDINAKYYFDQLFQTMPPYSNKVKLIGGYDKEFDEYLLTFDVRLQTTVSGISYSGGVYDFTISDIEDFEAWTKGWEQFRVNALTSEVGVDATRAVVRYVDTVDGYYKEAVGRPSDISIYPAIDDLSTSLNLNIGNDSEVFAYFRDCIAFSPKAQGWSSRYDFECDWWSQHSNKLASIKDGVFYKHNDIALDPSTYGNFYGTQYEAEVTFPFNELPNERKQPLAFEVESNNGEWYIDSAVNNRNQLTNVPNNYFEEREGEYYAPILRDSTTPNLTYPLLEGWKMIGSYLKVTLKNNSTSLASLFSTSLNYMFSKHR